ncbi:TetR family transcriptional regulator [Prosthecobacter fusiformis]|uniref:TetR family transcriptional regulator n=1 Tax=Prosthecobacter fusiformis TaxID=48464 RepID=A0A4V6Q5C5_9BACT|nr:TetR/AcrR family transcriptional regulator [Prosthecobacter fusiformis]TDU69323.1 TetR family transcriptional regulator [Prosthecobacter fusiformis]
MARPKSNDKRNAILDAAIRVIVAQGLSAPTATIAKEAGISNGSLFTYFPTKADLYNQLYLELKTGMVETAMKKFPAKAELQEQASYFWAAWMNWATSYPGKRRAMAQLAVSDLITSESRAAGSKIMADIIDLMERIRIGGSLRNVPMSFVGALMNSLAEATMDFMISDPANAKKHCKVGFETFWRAVN